MGFPGSVSPMTMGNLDGRKYQSIYRFSDGFPLGPIEEPRRLHPDLPAFPPVT
jgi:hypothetical protein